MSPGSFSPNPVLWVEKRFTDRVRSKTLRGNPKKDLEVDMDGWVETGGWTTRVINDG